MSSNSIGSATSKVEYIEVDSLGSGTIESTEDLVGATESPNLDPHEAQLLKRYCRKVDKHILVYAIVLCILNQSDRGSIGVAKVVGLEKDLGMVKNDFNIATTL
ncbi:hypothetical protein GGI21_003677, partial [Coemansia aciculifera]